MSDTKIEWADKVWNPISGCTKCSPGCDNCYARRAAYSGRLRGKFGYPKDNPFQVTWHQDRFDNQQFGKPCLVFVGSMTDLFHHEVDDMRRIEVFGKCADYEKHTFLVLTKRPKSMRKFFDRVQIPPPRNLWLGVSVCTNDETWKIAELLKIPAAVRLVSFEPLLEGITPTPEMRQIDWIIAGGETGPKARECDPRWIWALDTFAEDNGIPFFFKSWGNNSAGNDMGWAPLPRQFPKMKGGVK